LGLADSPTRLFNRFYTLILGHRGTATAP
jgi:hypothetical protein